MKRPGPGAKRLPGVKTHIDRDRRTILVSVDAGKADLEALKDLLYRILNAYENTFTVLIEGVTFCFLPDAYDHILPAPPRARTRRLPICTQCRLNWICPGLPPGSPLTRPGAPRLTPVLKGPAEIVFEVNRSCNLACGACSSRGLENQLTLAEITGQLREARRLGVKNVRFTGGEPFLHPKILAILAAAKEAGFHVLLNTNATLPAPALVKKSAPLIDNLLVSLQGCDASSEAQETGKPGLFEKKMANIRLFRQNGVKVLRLGTVISARLESNFKHYLALTESLNADIWELYRPMLVPGSAALRAKEVPPGLLRRLAARLEDRSPEKPRILFANPVPFCLFTVRQAPLCLGARFDDGHTRLVFDPRGFYKPSYYLEKDLGRDLLAAWNSPWLKKLDKAGHSQGKCRGCYFRLRCLGGSRLMAGADKSGSGGRDPWLRGRTAPRLL